VVRVAAEPVHEFREIFLVQQCLSDGLSHLGGTTNAVLEFFAHAGVEDFLLQTFLRKRASDEETNRLLRRSGASLNNRCGRGHWFFLKIRAGSAGHHMFFELAFITNGDLFAGNAFRVDGITADEHAPL